MLHFPGTVFRRNRSGPEALAAPMVVALCAQLLVVADMRRTGQHVATSARVSWPFAFFLAVLTCVDYVGSFGIVRESCR